MKKGRRMLLDWMLLIQIGIIIFLAAVLYKSTGYMFRKLCRQENLHLRYLKNILKAVILVAAVMLIIGLFPKAQKVLSVILASSGLIVAVLGFAAQESLSNIINGLFLSIFKPFEIGDRVMLVNKNITGIIEDLTLRHTVIRTITNTRLIIPNSVMNKELIENSHYTDSRAAMLFDIWVSYESDVHLAIAIMSELITKHPLVIESTPEEEKKPVQVLVRELGESGICLRATVWTATVDDNFIACSDLRLQIKDEFDRNHIEIPYPHYKIISSERNSFYEK